MSQVYNFLGSFNSQRLKAISRCCLTLYTYICWTVRALRGASGEPSAKLPSDSRGVPLAWLRGTTSMRLRGGSAEQTTTITSSELIYKFRRFAVSASQLHYNNDLCVTAITHVNLTQPVSLGFFLHLFQNSTFAINGTVLCRPDILPITQSTVSKHWRKHKVLPPTSSPASLFHSTTSLLMEGLVTLAWPPTSSSLCITDRSFRYASPCFCLLYTSPSPRD